MNRLTIVTLLIVCVVVNIASLVWIGYNVHPILTLILIIVEAWIVASVIRTEPKQNNDRGKINF
jgi:UPF0716 family protein affecting phage T7 exclusion